MNTILMQKLLPYFFLILPISLTSQTLDTAAARVEMDSLLRVSSELINTGKYEAAIQIIQRVEEKSLAVFGEESSQYATCLSDRGTIFTKQGNYEAAEPLLLKAKSIRERVLGKANFGYTMSLLNLAGLYFSKGDFAESEQLFLQASQSFDSLEGPLKKEQQRAYLNSLGGLGRVYSETGDFARAELMILEVIEKREEMLGKDHPDNVINLNDLGGIYWRTGNYEKVEPQYLQAMAILEKNGDKEGYSYLLLLNNRANINATLGKKDQAEELYLEAKDLGERTVDEAHPLLAHIVGNLAVLYLSERNFEKAEPLLLRSVEMRRKTIGEEHPDYGMSINNLGNMYREMGEYTKAIPYFQEVRRIYENAFGIAHPRYLSPTLNLFYVYYQMGDYEKAEPLQQIVLQNLEAQMNMAFSFLSEKEKETFIRQKVVEHLNQIQSIGLFSQVPGSLDLQYDIALLMKGIRLQSSKSTIEFLLQQQDLGALLVYQNLLAVRQELIKQYQQPVAAQVNLDSLKNREEDLEKSLARRSTTFRKEKALSKVTRAEVKASLKTGEAAIEFVHFGYQNPYKTDSVIYAAAVLLPDAPHVHFIPLFEEKQLGELMGNTENFDDRYVKNLYQIPQRGLTPNKEKGPSLYELIWQPLDSLLQDVETIYYSPSGLLHRLNLRAISVDPETTINDLYLLRTLASTRLLAMPDEDSVSYNDQAFVYGDVLYDYDTSRIKKALEVLDSTTVASTYRAYRGDSWNYLYWTKEESTKIQALLQVHHFNTTLRSQYNATEESVKRFGIQTASPRVLHLATHGFFFSEPSEEEEQGPVFKSSDHPMVRSGLILAGGNRAWIGEEPLPDQEDGILTAMEISQMNLTNTELVVLSACETGLGDIVGSEGVFGLQRAFKMAGVKYLIISLWQVSDRETKDLMINFYKNWLEEGMAIPGAFHAAQKEASERFYDPYYWAGFILLE